MKEMDNQQETYWIVGHRTIPGEKADRFHKVHWPQVIEGNGLNFRYKSYEEAAEKAKDIAQAALLSMKASGATEEHCIVGIVPFVQRRTKRVIVSCDKVQELDKIQGPTDDIPTGEPTKQNSP